VKLSNVTEEYTHDYLSLSLAEVKARKKKCNASVEWRCKSRSNKAATLRVEIALKRCCRRQNVLRLDPDI